MINISLINVRIYIFPLIKDKVNKLISDIGYRNAHSMKIKLITT
jgi:hypothetical protein